MSAVPEPETRSHYRVSFWLAIALGMLICSLSVVFTFWHVVGLAAALAGLALLRTVCHLEVTGLWFAPRCHWADFWTRRHRY